MSRIDDELAVLGNEPILTETGRLYKRNAIAISWLGAALSFAQSDTLNLAWAGIELPWQVVFVGLVMACVYHFKNFENLATLDRRVFENRLDKVCRGFGELFISPSRSDPIFCETDEEFFRTPKSMLFRATNYEEVVVQDFLQEHSPKEKLSPVPIHLGLRYLVGREEYSLYAFQALESGDEDHEDCENSDSWRVTHLLTANAVSLRTIRSRIHFLEYEEIKQTKILITIAWLLAIAAKSFILLVE